MGVLNEDYEIHTHSFIELVIILGGQAVHVVSNREYELNEGDVFVVSGHLSHGFRNPNNLQLFNLMFDMSIFRPFYDDFKKLSGFQSLFIIEPFYRKHHEFKSRLTLNNDELKYVATVLNLILKEFNEKRNDSGLVLKMHFFSLVAYLCCRYTGDRNAFTRDLFYLADTISYMENNFFKPLKVKDLAERANLSERHFSRVFVKNYHIPPMEYILRLSLQYAQKLLKCKDLTISQIADMTGFYDAYAFSRKFKEVYGLSPGKYKKLQQNSTNV